MKKQDVGVWAEHQQIQRLTQDLHLQRMFEGCQDHVTLTTTVT